ncbi:MAG TPA: NUDIX domain-containing protein [Verrucomicrobiae bacterium]|nr:NUDIX domain-containing protein [Verrucomicrobiae bacterium]
MTNTPYDNESTVPSQQLITACALIWHKFDGVTKIFLSRRPDDAEFLPGAYELPGGHIDLGENILTGLRREIKEELGVDVHIGDPFPYSIT